MNPELDATTMHGVPSAEGGAWMAGGFAGNTTPAIRGLLLGLHADRLGPVGRHVQEDSNNDTGGCSSACAAQIGGHLSTCAVEFAGCRTSKTS